ncbi:uncharacterized protein LOC129794457 [Lutzomyia longipalpis]|uniref:uncharacterized protein LOC129794457 n=1 Tax=Lutzomyia longipalpis TaxID=7200 RepID=UPI0024844132|nr:uncharacterized protein LOC129794457 [Lutzomyia longipalpis]
MALIVKMLPDTEIMGDLTDKFNAFPKEILLYAKIIPALEEIWMKAGYPVEFGPKMYFTAENPKSVIVMDDLKALGYKMVPRQMGLSLEEGKTVLAKLAKFHAASVIYYDQNGLNYDLLKEGTVRKNVKNELETYYNAMYNAYKISQAESTTFNVLNHGDAWTNNLMFNYQNEHPEVLCVDYQLSSWASPAIDLLYFLICAMNPDTLVKHFDDMIKFYHKELSSNFVKLQKPEKIPTLEEIEKVIRRKGFLGGMWIIETVPLINANSDFVLDLPAVFEGSEKDFGNKREESIERKL